MAFRANDDKVLLKDISDSWIHGARAILAKRGLDLRPGGSKQAGGVGVRLRRGLGLGVGHRARGAGRGD